MMASQKKVTTGKIFDVSKGKRFMVLVDHTPDSLVATPLVGW